MCNDQPQLRHRTRHWVLQNRRSHGGPRDPPEGVSVGNSESNGSVGDHDHRLDGSAQPGEQNRTTPDCRYLKRCQELEQGPYENRSEHVGPRHLRPLPATSASTNSRVQNDKGHHAIILRKRSTRSESLDVGLRHNREGGESWPDWDRDPDRDGRAMRWLFSLIDRYWSASSRFHALPPSRAPRSALPEDRSPRGGVCRGF